MAQKHDAAKANGEKSPEEIERDIRRTRAEIETTIDDLGDRLSPGQLVDQALAQLRASGAADGTKRFFTNLGRTVRDNPVPFVVTATGFVWLMSASPDDRDPYDELWADDDDSGRLADAKETISDATREARAKARHARAEMSRKQHELGVTARRQAARARRGWESMLDEQPLLLGLAGMALGALAGGGLPPSRSEDALFGEARDEAVAAAAEKGRDAAEHARETAEETRLRAERKAEDERTSLTTESDEEDRADSRPPFPPQHV